MAAAVTIQLVKKKLRLLKNNKQIVNQRLVRAMEGFEELMKNKDKNNGGGSLDAGILHVVYRMEDAIDTFLARKEFQKHDVFPLGMHLKSLGAETLFLNKMERLVDKLRKESQNDQSKSRSGSSARTDLIPKGCYHENRIDILDVDGRTKDLAELLLNHCSPFHIFVVDVAVSNTETMRPKIFDRTDIQRHFKCRAYARLSDDFKEKELLLDVLDQVRGKNELPHFSVESEEPERELRKILIDERYLIVFIDVRTPDLWEILEYAFPDSSNGSRVIFSFPEDDTARNPDIKFFGRKLLLKSEDVVEKDIVIYGGQASAGDPESSLARSFDYLDKKTDTVGLKEKVIQLAQLTFNDDQKYSVISVVGVMGSGKTTLLKIIYDNKYTKKNFECRAWVNVYVSYDFDMKNILTEILEQVTQRPDKEELSGLDQMESRLAKILSGKKFLIVLDDVHLPGAWYELERILSRGLQNGSRVILITRDPSVAGCFGKSVFHFNLSPLGEEDGWKLFLKKVKRDESKLDTLKGLRNKIWQNCQGLPLKICLLGGLLSDKSISNSDLIENIEKKRPGEKGKDLISSTEILDPSYLWTLSYKDLPPRLESYLHYLCLFPKSYEIPVRRLFHLCIAEGLAVTSEEEQMTPEDQVKRDFDELLRCNMIEVTRWKSDETAKICSVPRTIYEVFCPRAEAMGFIHVHRVSNSASTAPGLPIRRLVENEEIQKGHYSTEDIKYLHSYISFNTGRGDKPANEIRNSLNKTLTKRGFALLRVLDLERVYKPFLPESLGTLPLLSYVGLRWTFLESIPDSVGDLPRLETLDVKHTNITNLPLSIWKAKKLRHLYMNEIHFKIPDETSFSSDSLPKLQTLWGLLIGSRNSCTDWLKSLRGIRKLGLTCHTTSFGKITNWISELDGSLQCLRLRSVNDSNEPSNLELESLENHVFLTELYLLGKLSREIDISELPLNLKILTLSVSQLLDDPMPTLGELKQLYILRLFGQSYMGKRMKCPVGSFPKLHVLKLWVLKELKEWIIEENAMPELTELDIRHCKKLKKLYGLKNLSALKDLTLTNMEDDFAAEVGNKLKGEKTVIDVNKMEIDHPWV